MISDLFNPSPSPQTHFLSLESQNSYTKIKQIPGACLKHILRISKFQKSMLKVLQSSKPRNQESLKPRNHETKKLRDRETKKPRNRETNNPLNIPTPTPAPDHLLGGQWARWNDSRVSLGETSELKTPFELLRKSFRIAISLSHERKYIEHIHASPEGGGDAGAGIGDGAGGNTPI